MLLLRQDRLITDLSQSTLQGEMSHPPTHLERAEVLIGKEVLSRPHLPFLLLTAIQQGLDGIIVVVDATLLTLCREGGRIEGRQQ